MKRILFILAFTPTLLFAQTKINAAREFLGSKWNETMPAGKAVWQFEKDAIYTNPDGTWTFEKDLTNRFSFQNNVSYGRLKGITINGQPVQPGQRTQVEQVSSRVESKPIPVSGSPLVTGDSLTYAEKVDKGVESARYIIKEVEEKGRTTWAGFWKVFGMLKMAIGVAAIIFWFWASFAATESAINTWGGTVVGRWIFTVQQNSAACLFAILAFIGALYLIQWAFEMSTWDMPVEGKLILLFLAALVIRWIASWITPNPKVVGKKKQENNFPQLGA